MQTRNRKKTKQKGENKAQVGVNYFLPIPAKQERLDDAKARGAVDEKNPVKPRPCEVTVHHRVLVLCRVSRQLQEFYFLLGTCITIGFERSSSSHKAVSILMSI